MGFTITVNFASDPLNAESRDAFALAYGWTATVPDPVNIGQTIPNPVTKNQFRDQCIKGYVKEIIRSQRTQTAQAAVVVALVAD